MTDEARVGVRKVDHWWRSGALRLVEVDGTGSLRHVVCECKVDSARIILLKMTRQFL